MLKLRLTFILFACFFICNRNSFAQASVDFLSYSEASNGQVSISISCATENIDGYYAAATLSCDLQDPSGQVPFTGTGGYQDGESSFSHVWNIPDTEYGTWTATAAYTFELFYSDDCDGYGDGCYDDPYGFSDIGAQECDQSCAINGSGEDEELEVGVIQFAYSDFDVDAQQPNVQITPTVTTLGAGESQIFDASVANLPPNSSQEVTWTLTGAGNGTINGTQYTYTAPSTISSAVDVTVKACSVAVTTACDTATIELLAETIYVETPEPNTLVADGVSTADLTADTDNLPDDATVTWTVTPGTDGSITKTGATTAIFTAPKGSNTVFPSGSTAAVAIQGCITGASPAICSTNTLTLTSPITLSQVSGPWYAGTTTSFTITGTGFGDAPVVTLSDPLLQPSLGNVNASGTSIPGTITIPSTSLGETVYVTVTNSTTGVSATAQVSVLAATISITVAPAAVSLEETQQQTFTPTVTCKTANQLGCTVSQAGTWSISPQYGTISTNGLYTYNYQGLSASTVVVGKVCSTALATVCTTFSITLQPISVSVSPQAVTLTSGKTQQFSATVSGAPVTTSTFTAITAAQGTIANGLYTAPSPVTAAQNVNIQACSTVDPTRCGNSTVSLQLTPDFSVSPPTPSVVNITPGGKATYAIAVTPVDGFTGTVNLTSIGAPTGVTPSLSPSSVPGSGTSTLTLSSTAATPVGTYTITITGTSGTLVHSTTVTLQVNPDFTISPPTTSTVSIVPGATANYTMTIAPIDGFTGAVSLTATGLPTGASYVFTPTPVVGSGTSTLQLTAGSTTPVGTYTITVIGTYTGSGYMLVHSTTVTLQVIPNFTITPPATSSISIVPGGTASYIFTIAPIDGFTGTVNLSLTGAPTGVSYTFSPSSIAGSGTSTLKLTSSTAVLGGTYTITVNGTCGAVMHSTTVTLVVIAANFTIAVSGSANMGPAQRGGAAFYNTTIAAIDGFTGVVSLSVTGVPAGVTASFAPTSITNSGSSVLTLMVSSTAAYGNYTITVTGLSGTLTQSATAAFTIARF